jgi:hypothetical protein
MSAMSVENSLVATLASFCTREFTLEKSLMSAVTVEKPTAEAPISRGTRKFTLKKGLMSVKILVTL